MARIPTTSTTLLRDVSSAPEHPRWAEFIARYRPAMMAFMTAHFPSVEAEDILQETFCAIANALPKYVYQPDENGAFHNFLFGILYHKAVNTLRKNQRRDQLHNTLVTDASLSLKSTINDDEWRNAVMEIALQQLLADETIQQRTKQMFVRTAIENAKPADVAREFGVSRDVVDHAKVRLTAKLKAIAAALCKTR